MGTHTVAHFHHQRILRDALVLDHPHGKIRQNNVLGTDVYAGCFRNDGPSHPKIQLHAKQAIQRIQFGKLIKSHLINDENLGASNFSFLKLHQRGIGIFQPELLNFRLDGNLGCKV